MTVQEKTSTAGVDASLAHLLGLEPLHTRYTRMLLYDMLHTHTHTHGVDATLHHLKLLYDMLHTHTHTHGVDASLHHLLGLEPLHTRYTRMLLYDMLLTHTHMV